MPEAPNKPSGNAQPVDASGAGQAPNASLKPEALADFEKLPSEVRDLLGYALSLTEKNLGYRYSSCDPANGGMDCSGTVYHILQKHGWTEIPRQSNEMYEWTWRAGAFRAFNGQSLESFELKELRPGDLLFWVNTVGKTDRDPPVTHVMIYLGRLKEGGRMVMTGASDGRTYDNVRRFGVSVFDFLLPKESSSARFIGYAHLPPKPAAQNGSGAGKARSP